MKKPRDKRQIISSPPAQEPESYMTYPLSNVEDQHEDSGTSIPPLSDVLDAKEWVDNNHK